MFLSAVVLTILQVAVPVLHTVGAVHAVLAITNIRPVQNIAVLKDIPTTMTGRAGIAARDLCMMKSPAPVAREITPTTMMGNATSVPRGITFMTPVPVTAARRDIPIIMVAVAGINLVVQDQRYNKPPPTTQAAASAREVIPSTRTAGARTRRAMPITRSA